MNLPQSQLARTLLKPASYCYGLGSVVRLEAYSRGIMSSTRAAAPVVSIGNITVGGTGKTPVTIDIARRLIALGLKPAILSRGYKRQSREHLVVVSDGKTLQVDCRQAGDEPFMMAKAVPEAAVISCSSRIESSRIAVEQLGCNILVLDDGFQHIQLERDLDIVLVDYNDDLEQECVLPAGRLREPLSGMRRATDIVITKVPGAPDENRLRKLESAITSLAPRARLSSARFLPSGLSGSSGDHSLEMLSGKKVICVSGIARPESFRNTLTGLGAEIAGSAEYGDHYWFDSSDIDHILELRKERGADLIVTTSKDFVRMDIPASAGDTIFALTQETSWIGAPPELEPLAGRKS
ncbi:MAG: tetraacyldisaccharide 4'-kinase [Candidatus Obscuribacterales bacterium]